MPADARWPPAGGGAVHRRLALALALIFTLPGSGFAQRFGGQFGGAAGFWLVYVSPDVESTRSFDKDVEGVLAVGGRAFVQTGRVRLGGGGFDGSFTGEGLNPSGNDVSGGLSAAGFIAEYLLVRQDVEVAIGGMAGGGVLTIEERLGVTGDVETLNRRRDTVFVGFPWVRLGYNPAPFVNVGLQLGYLYASEDVGAFSLGIDVLVGLIP